MFAGLRRTFTLRRSLKELRGIRTELVALRTVLERFADHMLPKPPRAAESVSPDAPLVDISYVDDQHTAELMDIEMRLTHTRGTPPTEDEILAEFERLQETQRPPQGRV